jgi:hypothetical protein
MLLMQQGLRMFIKQLRFLFILFFIAPVLQAAFSSHDFINSFIKHYELTPEGRYVHEYHPFVLNKTADSFGQLEEVIKQHGYSIAGRNVIIGYEEAAVPCYYTNFKQARINDEASIKSRVGWSLKLHNRFGIMTGYLFKDVNKSQFYNKNYAIHHVNAEKIPLFDDRAGIFQEHAFGQALPLIIAAHKKINGAVNNGDQAMLLNSVIDFWHRLYTGGFKVGNSQIAGTQDILFSMQYADYLACSKTALKNYFIGPDITYPIEIFEKQEEEVTVNAQAFVKKFVTTLEPVNNKKTVYVFCSFVDGVGKSTMLGNIKNWMRYGDNIKQYAHVDNSSSQLAEMFQFKDNVFIADLPAQISHFTYKPDGNVFVDVKTELTAEGIQELLAYARKNINSIASDYQKDIAKIKALVLKSGWFSSDFHDNAAASTLFLRNIMLLKKENHNKWLPFVYKDATYLFDRDDLTSIRMLVPLAQVKSEGLKNIESEQMLFVKGVRLPLPYQHFLDNLMQQFAQAAIEEVVFVDFLSMYPRSSRENVRVNYLLQQLALLDNEFDCAKSLYRTFVSGGELLYTILEKETSSKVFKAFRLETIVRMLLYSMILERHEGDLSGYSLQQLTDCLQQKMKQISKADHALLDDAVMKKYLQELALLEETYGMSKAFVNVQQFFSHRLYALQVALQNFFTQECAAIDFYAVLWEHKDQLQAAVNTQGFQALAEGVVDKNVLIDDQETADCIYKLYFESKNELVIAPIVRQIRASWYLFLTNLLRMQGQSVGSLQFFTQPFAVLPIQLYRSSSKDLYVFQDVLESTVEQTAILKKMANHFTNGQYLGARHFGVIEDTPFLVDMQGIFTQSGLFNFANMLHKKTKQYTSDPGITHFVRVYQNDHAAGGVLSTQQLERLINSSARSIVARRERLVQSALQAQKKLVGVGASEQQIHLVEPDEVLALQLFVRMLATLEMVVKDPESDIALRFGNRDDFAAALRLIEVFVIPKYFRKIMVSDLFEDYSVIEPYPSWHYWDNVDEQRDA